MKSVITFAFWAFIVWLVVLASSCGRFVKPEVAVKAAETQGFADVQVKEHNYWFVGLRGCDEKDSARFVVEATNPLGKRVELIVCTGWIFKGATIRHKD